MERLQGTKQQSVHPYPAEPIPSSGESQRSAVSLNCNVVMQFLQRYPMLFWSIVWVGVLLTAGIAVSSLMSPGFINQPAPSRVESPRPTVTTDQGGDQTIPVWSLVAISASCAFGCYMISQRLRSQPQVRHLPRTRKPVKPRSPRPTARAALVSGHSSGNSSGRSQQTIAASIPRVARLSQANSQPAPAAQSQPSTVVPAKPVITVLPTGQSHPLDWNQPSLADDLDLRRRQPLSHWLQR
ncbi:hypothetical protein IQ268_04700 [Oculatella sp. LEGE 06141]|uniref:hypothetical protein n=1 Tax=Oculatella sp. LEGE 06141 TaxID=1828648 RepID=UPI00187F8A40|nr:hypothetical protein [Oculatella sp. LEGE 06141]MBE9177882.1 hypothetical protein [Oculatella sp. LEGE 06141]